MNSQISVNSVGVALLAAAAAAELSAPARRLGLDLLASAGLASAAGVVVETVDDLAGRVGVSWNRARVLLGELSRAGFITYWSYDAGGRRWCLVSWLAWSLGVARAQPAAICAECFCALQSLDRSILTDRSPEIDLPGSISGDRSILTDRSVEIVPQAADLASPPASAASVASGGAALTVNVYGEPDRSVEIVPPDTTVVSSLFLTKQTAVIEDNEQTNVRPAAAVGDGANASDRIVALLTDPDVGFDQASAARLACSPASFDQVLANVLTWRREVEAGKIDHPLPALKHRLSRGWRGTIIASDRHCDLYARHMLGDTLTVNVYGDPASPAPAVAAPPPAAVGDDPADPAWWGAFLASVKREQPDLAIWLQGSAGAIVGDRLVVSVAAHKLDWVRCKLSPWLRRRLAVDLGRPGLLVDVCAA